MPQVSHCVHEDKLARMSEDGSSKTEADMQCTCRVHTHDSLDVLDMCYTTLLHTKVCASVLQV